jgi:two-component system response regulator AdeR
MTDELPDSPVDHDREDRDGTPTVLVVDDDEDAIRTYEVHLESGGYEVVTAANGGEAIVELSPAIDVVLLDRRMPGMSGDEVLSHIRDWDSHVQVAMITAVEPGPDIMEMPFNDYLCKPVGREDLLKTVEELLLFERYEELLSEFCAVSRKFATLKSSLDLGAADRDDLAALEQRRETLRRELTQTIHAFEDPEIADVFDDIHASPEP